MNNEEISKQLAESCRSTLQACFIEGYNYGIEKAWLFIIKHFDATILDTNGSIGYGKEGINFEQFKQAMEEYK